MNLPALNIRPVEKRDTWAAFAFLFVFVVSHTILETARDALFLAKIPTGKLPWVYVAIAVLALLGARAQMLIRAFSPRFSLIAWCIIASVGTAILYVLSSAMGKLGLYALYVWSGVIATLVLIHFWSLLGDLFSVGQAKRLYGIIGVGSTVGAIVGSGLVSILAGHVPPIVFALMAAVGFGIAAFMPAVFSNGGSKTPVVAPQDKGKTPFQARVGFAVRTPYVRSVVLLTVLITLTVTFSDFLFKSVVARSVEPHQLARTFGLVYVTLNVLSLLVQLVAVGWLVRKLPLPWVMSVMPMALTLGSVGMIVSGGFIAALVMKTLDGSMRYSLHRTASELLLVPLGEAARRTAKSFMDVVGQRGAQMLASVILLAAVMLSISERVIAIFLISSAAGAALFAIRLRRHYVQIIREDLAEGTRDAESPFAHLDVATLETLIAALDSDSDEEVLTALRILEKEGKWKLVPSALLYHPSETVQIAVIRLFARHRRRIKEHIKAHLDALPSQRVRAEAIVASELIDADAKELSARLAKEKSPEVRAAITATMASHDMIPAEEAKRALQEIIAQGSVVSRIVVAEVMSYHRKAGFEDLLLELANAREAPVRRVAVTALGAIGGATAANALVDFLDDPVVAQAAKAALAKCGPSAISALETALLDDARPRAIRLQVPRVLAATFPQRASAILLERLQEEADGMVRYHCILALQHVMREHPKTRFNRALLDSEIDKTIKRAYRYIDRRRALQRGAEEAPRRFTRGHKLLVDLLYDKERNAVGRLFRLLSIRHPRVEFEIIYSTIESGGKEHKANALELIDNLLRGALRDAVVGLVDDVPDDERLARSGAYREVLDLPYELVVEEILSSHSRTVRDLAVYHVGELRMIELRPKVEALAENGARTPDVERTLAILDGAPSRRGAAISFHPELEVPRAG